MPAGRRRSQGRDPPPDLPPEGGRRVRWRPRARPFQGEESGSPAGERSRWPNREAGRAVFSPPPWVSSPPPWKGGGREGGCPGSAARTGTFPVPLIGELPGSAGVPPAWRAEGPHPRSRFARCRRDAGAPRGGPPQGSHLKILWKSCDIQGRQSPNITAKMPKLAILPDLAGGSQRAPPVFKCDCPGGPPPDLPPEGGRRVRWRPRARPDSDSDVAEPPQNFQVRSPCGRPFQGEESGAPLGNALGGRTGRRAVPYSHLPPGSSLLPPGRGEVGRGVAPAPQPGRGPAHR